MSRRRESWSELPSDLLLAIVDRLDFQTHILQVRAVCKAWRRSVAFHLLSSKRLLCPSLPHKISTKANHLLYSEVFSSISDRCLVLVASSDFLIKSVQNPEHPSWLLTVEERNCGKLCLRKPLSQAMKKLPYSFPRVLNLSSRFQISEVGRFYTLRVDDNTGDKSKVRIPFRHKVVLYVHSKSRTPHTIADYSALMLCAEGSLFGVRLKSESWHLLHGQSGRLRIDDIVNFKGEIYAIDRGGDAYILEYSHTNRLEFVATDPFSNHQEASCRRKRLAVWGDDLYLVHRCHTNSSQMNTTGTDFRVFKLNDEHKIWEWEEVEGIGDDKKLFAKSDGCFIASAKDFPGCKGNCIVFYRGCFPPYNDVEDTDHEVSVFHFDGRTCGSLKSYQAYYDVFRSSPPSGSLQTSYLTTTMI